MNTYYKDILKLIKPKFPNATINDIVKAERALRNPGYDKNNKIAIELRKIMADYHNSNYNEFLKFMKIKENKIMKKSELKQLIKEELLKEYEEEHEWGYTNDGWNNNDLNEIDLIILFNDVERLSYAIKRCRRGAYYKGVDDLEDLYYELIDFSSRFKKVAENLKLKIKI